MSVKGKKVLNIFKRIGIGLSIGFNVVFLVAVIIGSSGLKKQNNNVNCALAESDNQVSDKVNFKYDNKKYVFYDDENYKITLNVNELNNYFWNNFYDVINGDISSINSLNYNSMTFVYETQSYGSFVYLGGNNSINFVTDFVTFNESFNTDFDNYSFVYMSGYSTPVTFEYDLQLNIDSDQYDNIKTAINADIIANDNSNINDGIFETLTDSVVSFVGSLGSGIVAMTSIFYDSVEGELTTIGLLSVIVVAVSLAYFLFRLIIGLIRMRG